MASLAIGFPLSPVTKSSLSHASLCSFPHMQRMDLRPRTPMAFTTSSTTQVISLMKKDVRGRRVWRRRKLTKKDAMLEYSERVPFLEEQIRKIQEGGKLLTVDIEKLMLREGNRFDFVNEIAAEATSYVENNMDEYGGTKKAILHAISNRVNESGFYRPEAYAETDPFKPGPSYLKEEFT